LISGVPSGQYLRMRRYHHVGIPTSEPKKDEQYLRDYGLFFTSHQHSEYGVEWMRYTADARLPEVVKNVAHVAFEVDDLEAELRGKEVLIGPNSPSPGVRVAFILENGAPIEFLQFDKRTSPSCNPADSTAIDKS
jgi:hypothetical protein